MDTCFYIACLENNTLVFELSNDLEGYFLDFPAGSLPVPQSRTRLTMTFYESNPLTM